MRTIHTALPALAHRYPPLASEFRMIHSLLLDQGQGFVEMPSGVLTAAFEVIGLAPRRTAAERVLARDPIQAIYLLTIANSLSEDGYRSEPISMAVGVWTVLVARGGASYRGRTDAAAADYARLVQRMSFDLSLLIERAEQVRRHGESRIANVRAVLAENPGLRKAIAEAAAVDAQLSFTDKLEQVS